MLIVAREELAAERRATMRRVFGFCGVDPGFDSSQFEREWETGSGKSSRRASGSWTAPCGSPGCAPSIATSTACRSRFAGWSSAWSTIRTPAPHRSRTLDPQLYDRLAGLFRDDVAELERLTGRSFGWLSGPGASP